MKAMRTILSALALLGMAAGPYPLPKQLGQTAYNAPSGGASGVSSFNTRTGAVTLTSGDVTTALTFTPAQASHTHPYTDVLSVPTGTILYRKTAGTGAAETQTLATLKTDLGLTGTNSGDQTISITGDVTASGSTSALAATVTKINGTALSGLATGILKNTTTTGVPSIAVAADFPTLNQNTTGSAATLTTGRTIAMTGDVAWTSASFNGSGNVTGTSAIGANKVTNAMLAQVSTGIIRGRVTAATGNVEDLTGTQATTLLDVATTSLKGLLSAADKTKLDSVSSGASVSTVSVVTANGVSGSVATPTSTPAITLTLGAITPSSVASTGGITTSTATSSIGYVTGAGGAITQLTSKATAITINKPTGQITMNAAALATNTVVTFTVNNSLVAAFDTIVLNLKGGSTLAGSYEYWIDNVQAGLFVIAVRNITAASRSEGLILNFALIKAVNS